MLTVQYIVRNMEVGHIFPKLSPQNQLKFYDSLAVLVIGIAKSKFFQIISTKQ